MSPWTRLGDRVLVVLPRDADVLDGIADAAREAGVEGGGFVGLGAIEGPRLAWFDRGAKRYRETALEGIWEIANLTGNVALHEGELRVHCHATLGGADCEARAGHLVGGRVGVTCEVVLSPWDGDPPRRRIDPAFDLPLLDL